MARLQNQFIHLSSNLLRKMGHNFDARKNKQVIEMQDTLNHLEGKAIQFNIMNFPDGTWYAESVNIEGINTGSKNANDIPGMLRDAIFTYFEIPPHLCDDSLLIADNEPVTVKQKVHVSA